MITPSVNENDDILGFIPTWLTELSKYSEMVFVITPYHNQKTILPSNVQVFGLNNYHAKKKIIIFRPFFTGFFYFHNFLKLAPKNDIIFCHMIPNFTIFSYPFAKLFNKPIISWFCHGTVNIKMRMLERLADKIVTCSREGYKSNSDKVVIIGHGIDCNLFKPKKTEKKSEIITISSIGRISPRKNIETIILAADILINKRGITNLRFDFIGGVPLRSQEEYFKYLINLVDEKKLEFYLNFSGSIPHSQITNYYNNTDIFVSASKTDSIDKALLEAMACGIISLTCNKSFTTILKKYDNLLLFKENDPEDLADKIKDILKMPDNDKMKISDDLREIVKRDFDVGNFMKKLSDVMKGIIKMN